MMVYPTATLPLGTAHRHGCQKLSGEGCAKHTSNMQPLVQLRCNEAEEILVSIDFK